MTRILMRLSVAIALAILLMGIARLVDYGLLDIANGNIDYYSFNYSLHTYLWFFAGMIFGWILIIFNKKWL